MTQLDWRMIGERAYSGYYATTAHGEYRVEQVGVPTWRLTFNGERMHEASTMKAAQHAASLDAGQREGVSNA